MSAELSLAAMYGQLAWTIATTAVKARAFYIILNWVLIAFINFGFYIIKKLVLSCVTVTNAAN